MTGGICSFSTSWKSDPCEGMEGQIPNVKIHASIITGVMKVRSNSISSKKYLLTMSAGQSRRLQSPFSSQTIRLLYRRVEIFLWVYHPFHHLEGMKEDFKQTYCVTMSHEVVTEPCGKKDSGKQKSGSQVHNRLQNKGSWPNQPTRIPFTSLRYTRFHSSEREAFWRVAGNHDLQIGDLNCFCFL